MKYRLIAALAGVSGVLCALPAFAAWDRIGKVDVSHRSDHDVLYSGFGGTVERLALEARDSRVRCSSVSATFANGRTRRIFRGTLQLGRLVPIDLPGDDRKIERLEFNCKADNRRGTDVLISADIGRYQAEWRNSPDWDRMWSRMLRWTSPTAAETRSGGRGDTGWVALSTESFEGRHDRETTIPGLQGRSIDRLGFRPTNGDAECRTAKVSFGNGTTEALVINGGEPLREDHLVSLDLPGHDRNVTRVSLNCRAVRGDQVSIQVLARDTR